MADTGWFKNSNAKPRMQTSKPSIKLNGAMRPIDENTSLTELLAQLGYANKRLAVELNGDIVRRREHAQVRLQDGDRLEIVVAIGGG